MAAQLEQQEAGLSFPLPDSTRQKILTDTAMRPGGMALYFFTSED